MTIINAPSGEKEVAMTLIGNFCFADSVEYKDHGYHEEYLVKRGSETLKLDACGNSMDGGWLNVEQL